MCIVGVTFPIALISVGVSITQTLEEMISVPQSATSTTSTQSPTEFFATDSRTREQIVAMHVREGILARMDAIRSLPRR
jgi:hypothetical protein